MGVEELTPFNNFEVESSGMPRVPAAMNPRAEVVAVLMLFVLVEAAEEASIYNVEESCRKRGGEGRRRVPRTVL